MGSEMCIRDSIKPVLPDQVLTFDDVELDVSRLAFQMRRETEALLN